MPGCAHPAPRQILCSRISHHRLWKSSDKCKIHRKQTFAGKRSSEWSIKEWTGNSNTQKEQFAAKGIFPKIEIVSSLKEDAKQKLIHKTYCSRIVDKVDSHSSHESWPVKVNLIMSSVVWPAPTLTLTAVSSLSPVRTHNYENEISDSSFRLNFQSTCLDSGRVAFQWRLRILTLQSNIPSVMQVFLPWFLLLWERR